jgi:hypothetical protein
MNEPMGMFLSQVTRFSLVKTYDCHWTRRSSIVGLVYEMNETLDDKWMNKWFGFETDKYRKQTNLRNMISR